jgi:simple sugar transport system permease protein
MIVGGGIAGVAGMAQVSGIELRLRPDFSSSFGYVGFLASWLGEHDPWRVTFMAVLLAVIAVGGDQMQIAVHLPSSTISILTALFLFAVLATRRLRLWEGTAA